MSIKIFKIEDDLKLLCIQMIELLTKAKDSGLLSEAEYQDHIRLKQRFIEDHYKLYV